MCNMSSCGGKWEGVSSREHTQNQWKEIHGDLVGGPAP